MRSRETYENTPGEIGKDTFVAGLASAYTIFLVFAAGLKFLLLGFLIYAPGTILYRMVRREQNLPLFAGAESIMFGVAVVGAIAAVLGLVTGYISI